MAGVITVYGAGVTRTFSYAFSWHYTFFIYIGVSFGMHVRRCGAWGAGGRAVKTKGEDTCTLRFLQLGQTLKKVQ